MVPRAPAPPAGAAKPVAGTYRGLTGGRVPQPVEFRFLGSGIRDLTVGDRLVARWIPVGARGATAIVGQARIKLAWSGEREVSGWIQRGRGSKVERVSFSAAHRFARL
jgi:hypothetical protein